MTDRHVRRTGDDYAQALLSLLPQGQAWPRHPESILVQACTGLSEYWGFVDGRAADLLETESDPRLTIELLPDWERNWGLPDPCFFGQQQAMADRRRILMLKMTLLGGQSRAFFVEIMSWLGYTIQITEFAPYMTGVSRVGDTSQQEAEAGGNPNNMRWYLGPPEMRFYWSIGVGDARLTWFRTGPLGGEVGVDPHLLIGLADEVPCFLERIKPAHTQIVFDYSYLQTGGPMAGTP
ncbi:MAG TPA: putative phage tail protein [Pseudolabrys sp.]|jgi:uncharacterized protein YmfQ (DUF2313 family)|nr:putative phage tail protein [Pseudolabrys sp.]